MTFEICADSVAGALAAKKYGAKRIELCSALSVGGLTPNFGLIKACAEVKEVETHAMIRHREGDFCYTEAEVKLMAWDIEAAHIAGAKGVVFGILDAHNEVSDFNAELIEVAKSYGLETTFHRAFDFVNDPHQSLAQIVEMGFDRLLTSGQQSSAFEGLTLISSLQSQFGNQIQIMAGSGVNALNAKTIADTSGVQNLHFTARKPSGKNLALSMGDAMVVDEDKIENIVSQF